MEQFSLCHPEKKRYTKIGLCRSCYDKQYKIRQRATQYGKDAIRLREKKYRAANKEKRTEVQRRWRAKHKEQYKSMRHRNWIKRLYGLSATAYETKLQTQQNTCAICHECDSNNRRLSVDHDHSTGCVRGLLCKRCNTGLGLFSDNINLLASALQYLREYQV